MTKPNHPLSANARIRRRAVHGRTVRSSALLSAELTMQIACRQWSRTLKDATVKRYNYDSHNQLCCHLTDFIDAYNYALRFATLSGLTPYE